MISPSDILTIVEKAGSLLQFLNDDKEYKSAAKKARKYLKKKYKIELGENVPIQRNN
ncbi:MAG: hypothetical protein AAF821_18265 [Cyanobacteria bacterium P01_D01_bin.156]